MRSLVFVVFVAVALIGCPRKQAAIEGAVVHASASQRGGVLSLTLSVGPASTGIDEITYAGAEPRELVVRAAGNVLVPTAVRFVPTLKGGDVIVELPSTTASTLELAGSVVITNADGTDLDRVAVPAQVAVTP